MDCTASVGQVAWKAFSRVITSMFTLLPFTGMRLFVQLPLMVLSGRKSVPMLLALKASAQHKMNRVIAFLIAKRLLSVDVGPEDEGLNGIRDSLHVGFPLLRADFFTVEGATLNFTVNF